MSCVGHGFFGKGKKKSAVSAMSCQNVPGCDWKFYKYNYLVRHLSKYLRPFYSK